MRTDVFVKLVSDTRGEASLRLDLTDAFSVIGDIGRRFSRFRKESELSRLNASREMRVSPELSLVLSEALLFHSETDGIFDPSILGALEAEGYAESFGDEAFGIPKADGRDMRIPFTGLTVDTSTGIVRKPERLRIDLGGIAKGYAVDRAARMLRERGNPDFLIDAGGDIFASGRDAGHGYGYWAVDVSGPTGPVAILMLRDMAVATSGTDRRKWMVGGEGRHHLIDPRSGRSADSDILSATVVDTSVMRAEVFAKTLCILGRDRALIFARSHRIPALLVTVGGETVYTSYMKPYVFR